MFMATVAIITYFSPREGKFRYNFQESKPWKYGLLTAEFTFPIYKTETALKSEQDSILKSFSPYFSLNKSVISTQINKISSDFDAANSLRKVSPPYLKYIQSRFAQIYSAGVISASKMEELRQNKQTKINIIEGNVSKEREVSELYTVKSAYEYIVNSIPNSLNRSTLLSCDINIYILENLQYDEITSERVRKELLSQISPTAGVVQMGERIVDRGEIITSNTYNILRSLSIESEQRSGTVKQQGWTILGDVILFSSLFTFLFLFLYMFRYNTFEKLKLLFFILMIITGFAVITALNAQYKFFNIYIIPFAIVPIIIRTFFDSRTALFTNIITVMVCAFMAPFPFEFMLLQLTVGMTAIYSLKDLTQRSQLMQTAIFAVFTYTMIYLGYALIQEGDFTKINWHMFIYFLANGILILFSYLLIYMFEKLFGFVSHVTLVELSNINSPFLRKFSEECPGTFHHSLQVSNLASEASMKIGANTQLIRTAALYHDIGKMENPAFFTENQKGTNPHEKLEIEQSAKLIIDHVEAGARLARKIGLPQQIIDFIYTHQGTGKTRFFYNSYKNKYPEREIDEKAFMYPGPNPFTKETAIMMMADSVEAASRSLTEYTEESITNLVERIINGQIQEGMLNNAPITLLDIETIKKLFIEKLKTFYHTRVSYPELNNPKKEEPLQN
ncbi:MAG: HDIG domain-containing protein [Bacteroidales bacterium]|nr:HDIG domain-containing protein [Bacteroidales bacterium]